MEDCWKEIGEYLTFDDIYNLQLISKNHYKIIHSIYSSSSIQKKFHQTYPWLDNNAVRYILDIKANYPDYKLSNIIKDMTENCKIVIRGDDIIDQIEKDGSFEFKIITCLLIFNSKTNLNPIDITSKIINQIQDKNKNAAQIVYITRKWINIHPLPFHIEIG